MTLTYMVVTYEHDSCEHLLLLLLLLRLKLRNSLLNLPTHHTPYDRLTLARERKKTPAISLKKDGRRIHQSYVNVTPALL